MANNEFSVRYKLAAKTNLEWKAMESNFKPLLGEICFYIDTRQAKLGDGETYLKDLPFQWLTENEINVIINTLLKSLSATDIGAIHIGEKGVAKGVAELDENGHVLASQLPSFVDDIVEGYLIKKVFYEDSAGTKQIIPESGKIYVDLSNSKHKCYRWGGDASGYVVVSNTVTLGTTSDTAFRGDYGQTAYDHAVTNKGIEIYDTDNNNNEIPGLFKIKTNSDGHIIGYSPVTKNDILNLGIDGSNTTYDEATESTSGLMSASDKKKLDGIDENANNYTYTHPENSPYVEGFYKFEVDSLGHVVKATAVTKEDIVNLGISDDLSDNFVSKEDIIPIANGGTGATDATGAISNLGAVDTSTEQSIDAVKTFNKGLKIGDASMTYDAENKRIVFNFPD